MLNGVVPILAASTLWAFGFLARKVALRDISPVVLTAVTSAIVTLFMVVVFRINIRHLWGAFAKHWIRFAGLSLTGVALGTTFMFVALDHLDLGVAASLEKLQPIFTAVLAALFLNERFPKKLIPYCLIAIVSSYFISSPDPFNFHATKTDWYGIWAVLGAAFSWAAAGVIGKSLTNSGLNSPEITTIRFLIGTILLAPLIATSQFVHFHISSSLYVWAIIIITAIFSTGLGYILFYKGLKHVDASTSAFLELITPVISLWLGLSFLNEKLSVTQLIAIPVLLYAIYVIIITPKK
jgi:drug/metabolite transporter (DMT)-like permease